MSASPAAASKPKPWQPESKPPDSCRLVMIANRAWPGHKVFIGSYDEGPWRDVSGRCFDEQSDLPENQPPTHWKELDEPPAA